MPSWSAKLNIFGFCANCPFGRFLCVVVSVECGSLQLSRMGRNHKALLSNHCIVDIFFLTRGYLGDMSDIHFCFMCLKTSVTYTLPQHWHFSNLSWRHCKLGWCSSGFSCVKCQLQRSISRFVVFYLMQREAKQKGQIEQPESASVPPQSVLLDSVWIRCAWFVQLASPVVHG